MFYNREVKPLSDTWGINGKITVNAILNSLDDVAMQHAELTGDDVLDYHFTFIPFLVRAIRCCLISTSLILTSITSPVLKSSEGCLMYLSLISEM